MRRPLMVILTAVLLASCGGGEKKAGGGGGSSAANGGLVIVFDGSPTNLDPRLGTDTYSGRIWDMTASGVVKLTPSGDFAPDLAEKWETPDDKTIVFHLSPNAKFQDGRPVTSKDLKYTFESTMGEALKSPKKSGYTSIAGFETPDDHTFIVKMKDANAFVPTGTLPYTTYKYTVTVKNITAGGTKDYDPDIDVPPS